MTRADLAASFRAAVTTVGGLALGVVALAFLHFLTYLGALLCAAANGA
ncbi:MAG TPA: hypothetical protein VFV01_17005 [Spirillospora sp.]|nr:hypothetical protein [Spirillospora sp.]